MIRQYVHLFFLSPAWLLFLLLFFYFSPAQTHIAGRLGPTFLPLNFCFNEDGEPSNQKQQLTLCEPTPRPSWLEEFQNLIFLPSSSIYGFIFLLYLLSNQIEIGLGIEPKTWDSKQNISKYQSAIKPIPPLITPLYYLSLITCYINNCEFFFFLRKVVSHIYKLIDSNMLLWIQAHLSTKVELSKERPSLRTPQKAHPFHRKKYIHNFLSSLSPSHV